MINVRLIGHEYRYEIFQILVLFFNKEDISFVDDGEVDIKSILCGDGCALTEVNLFGKSFEESFKGDLSKKGLKNALKMSMLNALKKAKYEYIPWGILSGIRPTKIIHEYFKEGLNDIEAKERIIKEYGVYSDKAELLIEVAKNEASFLNKEGKKVSMYIDIPFCPSRCIYCSFTSTPLKGNEKLMEEYFDTLCYEIKNTLQNMKEKNISVDTLYIGGGTPTTLNEEQLKNLLLLLGEYINLKELREFTIECGRPDTINEEKLKIIYNGGCRRISINPQSMVDSTLKTIGRRHTSEDVIKGFKMAREAGFENINMDIIIGLPGEEEKDVEYTMNELKKLNPESITIHTMAVKRASKLHEEGETGKNESARLMYERAVTSVREMGMEPYYMYRQKNMVLPLENVGYSYNGKECIYNIQMIAENITIIAFGAGAITRMYFEKEGRIERQGNAKDIREYIKRREDNVLNKLEVLKEIDKSW